MSAGTGDLAALPAAFEAIPPRLNPYARQAIRHLDRWVAEQGLVVRTAARHRFDRANFGWFAALTYPTAGPADLDLIADWFAWLFLLDDQLDDGLLGKDPARAQPLLAALFAVLTGPPGQAAAGPGAPTIVSSLADLWRRTAAAASPTWRERFVGHVVAGGMAACWEADNRARGVVPTEASYVENRRHTGAIYVCMDLIEVVERIDLPAEVYGSAPFAAALDAACDVVCWTNDLYSLDKETALGEYHNLVTVTAHARGLSQAEAREVVAGQIADRLRAFLAYQPAAVAAARASAPGYAAEVSAYLAGMRSWMRGNLDWSATTRRYPDQPRGADHPARYLEAALVGGVGARGGGAGTGWVQ